MRWERAYILHASFKNSSLGFHLKYSLLEKRHWLTAFTTLKREKNHEEWTNVSKFLGDFKFVWPTDKVLLERVKLREPNFFPTPTQYIYFFLKSKKIGELRPLLKFQEISMCSLWDKSVQSFGEFRYMVVLFRNKKIAKTWNLLFSKTTYKNVKIFLVIFFLVNIFHFMQKNTFCFTWQCTFSVYRSNSVHVLITHTSVFL